MLKINLKNFCCIKIKIYILLIWLFLNPIIPWSRGGGNGLKLMLVERSQLIAWLINNCLIHGPMCVMEGSQQHPAKILWSSSLIGRRRVSHSTGTSVTWELSLGPLKPALENNIHLLMGTWPWAPFWYWNCSFKKSMPGKKQWPSLRCGLNWRCRTKVLHWFMMQINISTSKTCYTEDTWPFVKSMDFEVLVLQNKENGRPCIWRVENEWGVSWKVQGPLWFVIKAVFTYWSTVGHPDTELSHVVFDSFLAWALEIGSSYLGCMENDAHRRSTFSTAAIMGESWEWRHSFKSCIIN